MSRVLLVHADAAIRERLQRTLEGAGFSVHAVTSGERAMDLFIQEPADVVVIDYSLEGRDGLSTAEAIRWMPGGRRARVILTSAREPEEASLARLGADVDAFATLVGPVDEARLADEVRAAAAVEPHTAETRIVEVEEALLEAERARERMDETLDEETLDAQLAVDLAFDAAAQGDTPQVMELEDATLDEPSPADWELDGVAEGREVRAIAEAARETHSDLLGRFEQMSFARVLHRLAKKRATGALICVHAPDERATTEGTEPTKVVYFRAGVPVHVRSNLVTECLGQVLTRTRRIGPEALRASLSAVRRGEGKQGEVLVSMGAIGPLELSEGLAEQLRVKLFDLFAWRRGTFRFSADRRPPLELIDLELGLAEIVTQGIRRGLAPERVLELLAADRDRFVIPRAREMVRFVQMQLDAPLRELVRRIDGRHTLGELLDSASEAGGDEARSAQLMHAMECLEAVRFADEPLRARSRAASDDVRSDDEIGDTSEAPPAPMGLPSVPSAVVATDDGELGDDAPPAETTGATRLAPSPFDAEATDPGMLPVREPSARAAERDPAPPDPAPPDGEGSGARPATTASPEELDDRVARLFEAERHFRRGHRALDKGDAARAIGAFERAVALCGDEGQFVAYLGWARHRASPDDPAVLEAALRDADQACALAPEMSDVHRLRGRLLEVAGRHDEARDAMTRARSIEAAAAQN